MTSLLITEIKSLVGIHSPEVTVLKGSALAHLPVMDDAWLLIEGKHIVDYGTMTTLPAHLAGHNNRISAKGQLVLPSWCDSHTHLVFAESREEEFVMKINGKSYEEIAENGGGILNSANKVRKLTEDELFESSFTRLNEIIGLGTGAVEIKSGYGLSVESELKMLRVIRRLKNASPIPVKSTFLAAHAYPKEFRHDHDAYIDLIINEMLPKIHNEGLADYIDVFCEKGFFSNPETSRILDAGAKYGLRPKVHANQLSASGAVETAIKHSALSVDHLEMLDENSVNSLRQSNTIATLLPGCFLFLGIPFANARRLVNAGIPVAVASDCNPGSAPSGNMNLVVSLACMCLKMLPGEAINAATINGAAAMELATEYGSITRGKIANLIITKKVPSLNFIPYSFGSNLIDTVIVNGEIY